MEATRTTGSPHGSSESPDFSLVLGGPWFQLLVRSRLATPALELLKRRIVFITLFAWLPLLLLSVVNGRAWSGTELPFLCDIEMQARYLIALPLLIAAELLVHQRLRVVVAQFVERNIISQEVLPKFRAIIASAMKLRNSRAAETILFIVVFLGGYYIWSRISGLEKIGTNDGSWYAAPSSDGMRLFPAGYWYAFVSRPVFQFLLVRWYFRLFIWARFLWQTSHLELNLIPIHPDRAAGLGFLGRSSMAFAPLLLAHGALLAGVLANPILFSGARLTDFKAEILVGVSVLMLLVLGPLLAFSGPLMRARRTGLREYGVLACRYVEEFDQKWVRGGTGNTEQLLGSGDIQSLADMGNSFQVIREIRPFPFGKSAVLQLIVIALIPISPLILTMMPLEELVKKLLWAIL